MKRTICPKPLKDALLSIRVPAKLKLRVLEVEKLTRIAPNVLVEEAMEAICRYVEHHGELSMPLHLVSPREMKILRQNRDAGK